MIIKNYKYLFVILILAYLAFSQSLKKDVAVFIRVDDIFMKESSIQPQEIDEFLKIAEKHNARVILATIPARLLQPTNINGKMSLQLIDYANRGHQIAQHGYNHRCPFTNSTNWEFYTPNIKGYTKSEIFSKILEGKLLLESVIGQKVTNYVGPGNDNDYVLIRDEENYRELGFKWLTDQNNSAPYLKGKNAYFFSLNDYAWGLTDSSYTINMDEAKEDFLKAVKNNNSWGILFHDHFTRANYKNGITLKWFDELLQWLDNHPEYSVKYYTLDEWYNTFYKD